MNGNEGRLKATAETEALAGECPQAEEQRSDEKEKRGVSAFLTELMFGMMYALWGYLLGGAALPFGAKPLGIALLCSADRRVFFLFAGLCVSAWRTQEQLFLIAVYAAALLLRILVRLVLDTPRWRSESELTLGRLYPLFFSEHLSLRMATAAIAAFAVGLRRLTVGGFLYYDLYGTLLAILVAPTAVLLFTGFFSPKADNRYRRLSGFLAIAFALIWAARGIAFYGISASAFGCMFATLYLTRKQGIVVGVLTGTVCGLAVSPSLAPLFAFAALSAGILFGISVLFAATAAFSAGLSWGIYVSGLGALNGLLGGLLAASVLFVVLDKLFFTVADEAVTEREETLSAEKAETVALVCSPDGGPSEAGLRLDDTNRRVKQLCESFSSLSDMFYALSRKMQMPAASDLRQICDNAFDNACTGCPERTVCWSERYHETCAEVGNLSALLHRNGHLERGDLPPALAERCGRSTDILEAINHNTAMHQKQILQGDRTEIFAMDYGAISELLSASMVCRDEEYAAQAALTDRLCTALNEQTDSVRGARVYGERQRRVAVCGRDREALLRERDTIEKTVRTICPFPMESGVFADREEPTLEFVEAQRLSVVCAGRSACADGEEKYCGDTTGLFRRPDGFFFAFISDGMGSGREAALTSGVSGLFLRRLLETGASCETTLGMLNGVLRNRGSGSLHECSATVDLMELDLIEQKASFYKSGAAPTYVFRNGSLFKLRSHTVPVGIIRELDTRRIGFDVSAGDVIVMVSDGVTRGREECPWLFDLLRSQGENAAPDRLADLIVKYAKNEGACDDISVLIVKLQEAEATGK